MGHLGEGKQITTINDEEVVLTTKEGQNLRMNIVDLGLKIKDIKRFKMPIVNKEAVKICSIKLFSHYYNASVFVRIDSFQLSVFGIIGFYNILTEVNPFAKLYGYNNSVWTEILFVRTGDLLDIYITGSYPTTYSSYNSEILSTCELVSFDGAGSIVNVSSLNVMKSINVADAIL